MDPTVLHQLPPTAQASLACLAQIVHHKVEYLRQGGFVNYFGLQRFGKTPFLNYETGRRILRHEYGEVVDLLIGQQSQLHPRGKFDYLFLRVFCPLYSVFSPVIVEIDV